MSNDAEIKSSDTGFFNWSLMHTFYSITELKTAKLLPMTIMAVIALNPQLNGESLLSLPVAVYNLLLILLCVFFSGFYVYLYWCPSDLKKHQTFSDFFKSNEELIKDELEAERQNIKNNLMVELSQNEFSTKDIEFIVGYFDKQLFEEYKDASKSEKAKEKWKKLQTDSKLPLGFASLFFVVTNILAISTLFIMLWQHVIF